MNRPLLVCVRMCAAMCAAGFTIELLKEGRTFAIVILLFSYAVLMALSVQHITSDYFLGDE